MALTSLPRSDSEIRRSLSSIPEAENEDEYGNVLSRRYQRGDRKHVRFFEVNSKGERVYSSPRQTNDRFSEPEECSLTRQSTISRTTASYDEQEAEQHLYNQHHGISLSISPPPKPPGEQRFPARQLTSIFQSSPQNSSPETTPARNVHAEGGMKSPVAQSEGWYTLEFGTAGTQTFRMLFLDERGKEVSPWHDIPLYSTDGCLNFVCKTPRFSWAEYEPARAEPSTPLKLKTRRGAPLHYAQNAPWNLGMLPRTWADPELKNECYGGLSYRSGPIEVVEVGSKIAWTGDVYSVKALAAFAMVDPSARLSWIVIAIDARDPLAKVLETAGDVEKKLGTTLREVREWLRTCRCVQEGDRKNVFGLNERAVGQLTVARMVAETHASWQLFIDNNSPKKASDLPLVRPANPATYESYWSMYHYPDFLSPVQIELCDPSQELLRSVTDCSVVSSESSEAEGFWSSESSEELVMSRGMATREQQLQAQHLRAQNAQDMQRFYASSNLFPPQHNEQNFPMRLPEPPNYRQGVMPELRQHSSRVNHLTAVPSSLQNSQLQSQNTAAGRSTAFSYDRYAHDNREFAQFYEEPSRSPVAAAPSPTGRTRSDVYVAASASKMHRTTPGSQSWDGQEGQWQSPRLAARTTQWSPRCGREEAELPHKGGTFPPYAHRSYGDSPGHEGLKSPRGHILEELPPSFDKIAFQLDKTEEMHARFNSRLAATKVLLERLRLHAESDGS